MFGENAAFISAIILTTFPHDLLFAGSGQARPTSLFFVSLTLLFYLIALGNRRKELWALVGATFSYSIYVRQENIVLLLPMVVGLFLFDYFKNKEFRRKKPFKKAKIFFNQIMPALVVFLITQAPVQYWILFSKYLGEQQIFMVEAFLGMVPVMLMDFFNMNNPLLHEYGLKMLYNPLISLLFFASLVFLLRKKESRKAAFVWLIFLTYFILYSSYFTSLRINGFDRMRFSYMYILPVSILASLPLSEILKRFVKAKEAFFVILFIILLMSSGLTLKPHLFKDNRIGFPETEATYFKAIMQTPNNCTIITSRYLIPISDAIPNNNRRTINLWLVNYIEDLVREEIEYSDCVISFEDDLYNRGPIQRNEFLDGLQKEFLFNLKSQWASITAYKIKRPSSSNNIQK
jgi:4-amino-4-deoxy-L-arabinose transferase-like glycosyltransferase